MSREQIITFAELERISIPFERKDTFSFRPDRRWRRTQRLCFWLLRKIGAYDWGSATETKRHTIDTGKAAETIMAQERAIFELYHHRGERVLIGPAEWEEFMQNAAPAEMYSVTLPYNYGAAMHVFGMKVTLVPWMNGILVVPSKMP